MKIKPKKILPQSAKDEILLFLANCGGEFEEIIMKIIILLYIILAFEATQTLLSILKLLRQLLN